MIFLDYHVLARDREADMSVAISHATRVGYALSFSFPLYQDYITWPRLHFSVISATPAWPSAFSTKAFRRVSFHSFKASQLLTNSLPSLFFKAYENTAQRFQHSQQHFYCQAQAISRFLSSMPQFEGSFRSFDIFDYMHFEKFLYLYRITSLHDNTLFLTLYFDIYI